MSETTPEPTDTTRAPEEGDTVEESFDRDDLVNGPDDVVHNSDAPEPGAEPDAEPDAESDPALDDGTSADWTDEGGATENGPATDTHGEETAGS
ncbi:hypothetical protein ACOACQ_03065 [Nocardioides sp. CPCC 206347]|uniref:hypothetical protein n=1 Tax=unclassified Nocardioides TaxID=2615069 RepID=UPI00360E675B